MKLTHRRAALAALFSLTLPAAYAAQCSAAAPFAYPASKKVDQVDTYHGVKVADPYRWLEDDNSAETADWVNAQNKLTQDYLAKIPQREAIKQRLAQLMDYERYGVPRREGGRYFYSHNSGLQNQSVLYTTQGADGKPQQLLDPNTLSTDGTMALSTYSISPGGKYIAYAISASGSDWIDWKVRDVATGRDTNDSLKWTKFTGAAWKRDGSGFFYSRYPAADEKQKMVAANNAQQVYFHKLGTPQAEDTLVYERKEPGNWLIGSSVTDDGAYLVISISQGSGGRNRVYYKALDKADSPVVPLLDANDNRYSFVDNVGSTFFIKTDNGAETTRVIAVDLNKPNKADWKDIIPAAKENLQSVGTVGGRIFASYLKDAYSLVKVYKLDGSFERDIELPGIGKAEGFGGRVEDGETFYSFTSFTTPTRIYRYDIASGKSTVFRESKVAFNPDDFKVKQVFYASKDGTKVPMFLVAKKGIALDGKAPTYLYGYGGFNIPMTPAFSTSVVTWLEMGGVYAVANLRGGGEYGREWHQAGTKLRKQNVFDDFIAAAEYLIKSGVTNPQKLAIGGGSNGGLLVGAVMEQRPDLFAAALPAVGVMDMLRFHKFTIGWNWTGDYGSSDNADEFKAIYAYSPLHNLKSGTCYPATMITTADHDDRVVPAHSFKFAAAAQAAANPNAPMLIRIESKAGHGAGKPTAKIIEEAADKWAFLVKTLGM